MAFRSHRAMSTAEMASEATPGRPTLRQALRMASLAFGTPKHLTSQYDTGEDTVDHALDPGACIGPAQPFPTGAPGPDQHHRRRRPGEGAVRLGTVGGHLVHLAGEFVDPAVDGHRAAIRFIDDREAAMS